jgi:hypothetical protein
VVAGKISLPRSSWQRQSGLASSARVTQAYGQALKIMQPQKAERLLKLIVCIQIAQKPMARGVIYSLEQQRTRQAVYLVSLLLA